MIKNFSRSLESLLGCGVYLCRLPRTRGADRRIRAGACEARAGAGRILSGSVCRASGDSDGAGRAAARRRAGRLGRAPGAPTDSFAAAQHYAPAPLSALGCFRLGEDGRLYFAGKSEHYHIPLGHGFPGYALLDKARALGIPNATHNNTRGYITRLLERRLIAAANGRPMDEPLPQTLLQARQPAF